MKPIDRRSIHLAVALLGAATFLSSTSPSGAQESAAKSADAGGAAALAELAWIAGTWEGEFNGAPMEERWNPPMGDCMLGSFRVVEKGKLKFCEILIIEATDQGPVFRLKHFGRGLVGWEEKEEAIAYKHVSHTKDEVIFENTDKRPGRFIYRKEGADGLLIRIEETKDGKPKAMEFRFKRQAPA